ncbi:UNVERIFIED_CONTAM: hypothetical protein HDU68_001493 [Siphonaria sp. JEL0065]|nr:hypothetical protein HDU68_001493 [Siphonaria sp. JEL0065]
MKRGDAQGTGTSPVTEEAISSTLDANADTADDPQSVKHWQQDLQMQMQEHHGAQRLFSVSQTSHEQEQAVRQLQSKWIQFQNGQSFSSSVQFSNGTSHSNSSEANSIPQNAMLLPHSNHTPIAVMLTPSLSPHPHDSINVHFTPISEQTPAPAGWVVPVDVFMATPEPKFSLDSEMDEAVEFETTLFRIFEGSLKITRHSNNKGTSKYYVTHKGGLADYKDKSVENAETQRDFLFIVKQEPTNVKLDLLRHPLRFPNFMVAHFMRKSLPPPVISPLVLMLLPQIVLQLPPYFATTANFSLLPSNSFSPSFATNLSSYAGSTGGTPQPTEPHQQQNELALTQDLQSLVLKHYPQISSLSKVPGIIKFTVLVGGQLEEFQLQRCWSVPGSGSFSGLFGSQDTSSGGGCGFGGGGGSYGGLDKRSGGGGGGTTKRKEGSDGNQQDLGGGGDDGSGVVDKRIRRVNVGSFGEIVDTCEDMAISDTGAGREENDGEEGVPDSLVQDLSDLSLRADRQEPNATSSLVDNISNLSLKFEPTTPRVVISQPIDSQGPSFAPSNTTIIHPSYSSAATLFGSAETRIALDDVALEKQNAEISAKVDAVIAVCPPEYSREVVERDVIFTGSVEDTIERIFSGTVKPYKAEDLLGGISGKTVDTLGEFGEQQQVIFAATLPGIQEEFNGDDKDQKDEKGKGKLSGSSSQGSFRIPLLPPQAQNHQVQVLPLPPPNFEYVLFNGQLFVRPISTNIINRPEPSNALTLVNTIEKPRDADRILEERVNAVMEICPTVPRELVVVDLRYTGSVEDTVERIFSGALKVGSGSIVSNTILQLNDNNNNQDEIFGHQEANSRRMASPTYRELYVVARKMASHNACNCAACTFANEIRNLVNFGWAEELRKKSFASREEALVFAFNLFRLIEGRAEFIAKELGVSKTTFSVKHYGGLSTYPVDNTRLRDDIFKIVEKETQFIVELLRPPGSYPNFVKSHFDSKGLQGDSEPRQESTPPTSNGSSPNRLSPAPNHNSTNMSANQLASNVSSPAFIPLKRDIIEAFTRHAQVVRALGPNGVDVVWSQERYNVKKVSQRSFGNGGQEEGPGSGPRGGGGSLGFKRANDDGNHYQGGSGDSGGGSSSGQSNENSGVPGNAGKKKRANGGDIEAPEDTSFFNFHALDADENALENHMDVITIKDTLPARSDERFANNSNPSKNEMTGMDRTPLVHEVVGEQILHSESVDERGDLSVKESNVVTAKKQETIQSAPPHVKEESIDDVPQFSYVPLNARESDIVRLPSLPNGVEYVLYKGVLSLQQIAESTLPIQSFKSNPLSKTFSNSAQFDFGYNSGSSAQPSLSTDQIVNSSLPVLADHSGTVNFDSIETRNTNIRFNRIAIQESQVEPIQEQEEETETTVTPVPTVVSYSVQAQNFDVSTGVAKQLIDSAKKIVISPASPLNEAATSALNLCSSLLDKLFTGKQYVSLAVSVAISIIRIPSLKKNANIRPLLAVYEDINARLHRYLKPFNLSNVGEKSRILSELTIRIIHETRVLAVVVPVTGDPPTPTDANVSVSDPSKWTMEETASWLEKNSADAAESYANILELVQKQRINGTALLTLPPDEVVNLLRINSSGRRRNLTLALETLQMSTVNPIGGNSSVVGSATVLSPVTTENPPAYA